MAAPITHIVLALKILPTLDGKVEKEFILGAAFPDIHHLDVVQKAKVHFTHITLEDIKKEQDSFKAGMMFHSYINALHEDFYKNRVKTIIPSSRFSEHAFKFKADIVLVRYLNKNVVTYFDTILPQQKNLKIAEHYLQAWHKALKNYILHEKNQENRFKFLKRCAKRKFRIVKDGWFVGAKKAILYKVNKLLFDQMEKVFDKIDKNDQIEKLILEFYAKFLINYLKPI